MVSPWNNWKIAFLPRYLGLVRLYPFGEYLNDAAVQKIKKNLPAVSSQKMGDIKTRADFESDKEGIDSNTISAGEDNLFIIICALVSLRYYFENIASHNDVESILLIDEFDATLHPSLQNRLLKIFREYAEAYKIQIIFTTQQIGKYKLDARFNRQRTSFCLIWMQKNCLSLNSFVDFIRLLSILILRM